MKQELLTRLQQIINEQLGVRLEAITEKSTWSQLGADSLDRLEMSRVLENAFNVEIPHEIGERLNTVGETIDYVLTLITPRREIPNIRIEAATTSKQWAEMLAIRNQVFSVECGFTVKPLPGPGVRGVWHLLARDNHDAIGTLSMVDTTEDRYVCQRYRLNFGEHERVVRYAQLAILKPYRKRGIFEMLIETARSTVIRPNGFAAGWLLCPAARTLSSMLTRYLGFSAEGPVLATEFGKCRVVVRRELTLPHVMEPVETVPVVETRPIRSTDIRAGFTGFASSNGVSPLHQNERKPEPRF
jgi:acyl carrier protein